MIAAVEQFLRDTLPPAAPPDPAPRSVAARRAPRGRRARAGRRSLVSIPVLGHDAVLAAVSPAAAIERVREAFAAHHAGEWTMPSKVYLQSPPHGDFRAMPALGGGFAMLKWISSFPGNPIGHGPADRDGRRLPVGRRDERAADAARRARRDRAAHGRGGGGGGGGARAPRRAAVGVIGCGLHGAWAARCLAAAGYGPGVCARPAAGGGRRRWRPSSAGAPGAARTALGCDVVCCVTPGHEPVVDVGDLRPGLHLNMLGADGPGKAEATVEAVSRCALFCDEWAQASHGGELTGAVEAGVVARDDVTDLGAVLAGAAAGRADAEAVTLFDSTGLAIQDLAIAIGAHAAWRDGRVDAQTVAL